MASPQQSVAEKVARTKSGKERKRRPDGTFYSSDPKERHRQLVEDGKIGGKGSELAREQGRKGGRPRNVSAQELVAQKAREEAEDIWDELINVVRKGSTKQRLDAIKLITDIEERVERRRERDVASRRGLDRDKLIEMLVERVTGGGPLAALVQRQMREQEQITDADVVEEDTAALPPGGQDRADA